MSEKQVKLQSGVSWFHDTLMRTLEERHKELAYTIAGGVPDAEYRQMVGRFKETERMMKVVVPDLFAEFEASDAGEIEEDDGLEEMKDAS